VADNPDRTLKKPRIADRGLLKRAASAAGHTIDRWVIDENGVECAWLKERDEPWQPLHENTLTDCMGDALRLAVALQLTVLCNGIARDKNGRTAIECDADPCVATRRAIVKIAAKTIEE
jgi:hypothetical protein